MAIPRFNGAAAWAVLTESERAAFGAMGLELIVAIKTMQATEDPDRPEESTDDPTNRAAHASAAKIITAMDGALRELSPALMVLFGDKPPVPSLVGDVCERCGCTEEDACDGGCAWAQPGCCTSCIHGRMEFAPADIRKARALS